MVANTQHKTSSREIGAPAVYNLLFATDSRMGGTTVAAVELARCTSPYVHQCLLAGPTDPTHDYLTSFDPPVLRTQVVSHCGFSFMPTLRKLLDAHRGAVAALHLNGMWNCYNLQAATWARKNNRPVFWTVHGELDPTRLRYKRFKKLPYLAVALPLYRKSVSFVRAITERERALLERLGFGSRVHLIPNGITKANPHQLCRAECKSRLGVDPCDRVLLFASRLSPEKGIKELASAFAAISPELPDWRLIVAGSTTGSSPRWLREVKRTIASTPRARYLGHWPASEKALLYGAADCFILPTFSDVMSLVVLEASSYGVPSIITPECDFPKLTAAGGAFSIRHSTLAPDLRSILYKPRSELEDAGVRARTLVEAEFLWKRIGVEMAEAYRHLIPGT